MEFIRHPRIFVYPPEDFARLVALTGDGFPDDEGEGMAAAAQPLA